MSYTIVQNWLPTAKYDLKAPYAMTPEGIVVHNTAGSASAAEEVAAMIASPSPVSFHVAIDEAEAVEAIPFSRNAWHAGDGSAGYANRHLIAIEIARSADESSDRFDQAEKNAVEYIAHVCRQYGWTSEQLHQHNWYSATDCPHRTREDWASFCNAVDIMIHALDFQEKYEASGAGTLPVIVNGEAHRIRGYNISGSVFLAIRDLAEILDYNVTWEDGAIYLSRRKE